MTSTSYPAVASYEHGEQASPRGRRGGKKGEEEEGFHNQFPGIVRLGKTLGKDDTMIEKYRLHCK